MTLFKRERIDAILQGRKTQTRRLHKHTLKLGGAYDIKANWYHKEGHKIVIARRYRQWLGDIPPGEALKEGSYSVEEFIKIGRRSTVLGTPMKLCVYMN